jgi:two-component system, chemotaxis family, response regulator Rcp1
MENTGDTNEQVRLLLVEDNAADADLTRESLQGCSRPVVLCVCATGNEALDFVHRRGRFAGAETPDLILLDLNLPGVHGKEVLAAIKRHPELKRIPVSVLTSSNSEKDITQSYELGATCYLAKPLDFRSCEVIVRTRETFWFSPVEVPPRREERGTARE